MADAKSQVARALRASIARLGFTPDDTLIVAFSGGQDSTCLLHALTRLRRGRARLVAAHIDHGLRPESAADAERATSLARGIGVEAISQRVDVPAYRARRSSWSVQDAARAARYQALAAIVQQYQAAALLTAHTADDQAETMLLHLLRGSGLRGLSGIRLDEELELRRLGPPLATQMAPPARVRLARPLLIVPRATTLAYCSHFELRVVEDATNVSRVYARNRVRLDLLPALERFNPAIREVLARTADLAAEDHEALEAIVAQRFGSLIRGRGEDAIEFDLAGWRAEPRALQRRLLRHALEQLLGDLVDIRAQPIEDALELLRAGHRGQAYHLPHGIELSVGSQHAILRRHGSALPRNRAITEGPVAPCV